MGVLLDLLLLTVIARAVWRLISGVLEGMSEKPQARKSVRSAVHMARDPVCGTFVVPDHAVSLTIGDQRTYFCSASCRDQFRNRSAASPGRSGEVGGAAGSGDRGRFQGRTA